MINIWIVLTIIFIHWIADFVLQTDRQAKGKSNNWNYLLSHTTCYSLIWLLPILFFGLITETSPIILLFIPITFITHTAIDYYTSRVNAVLHTQGNIHGFFVSIGFDQVLHYIQLLLTYYYLTN